MSIGLSFASLNSDTVAPLSALESQLVSQHATIEAWFRAQWRQHEPPLYASVDIRNASFKIAPVDTNLFPAGFNNLNPAFYPLAIQALQIALEDNMPGCRRVLLIPENHTRNKNYFTSVGVLHSLLEKAGFEVRIGTLLTEYTEPTEFVVDDNFSLTLWPVQRVADRVVAGDFDPCVVVLNHDLSDGLPPVLRDCRQPVFPNVNLGWDKRLKSNHFKYYAEVVNEFAEVCALDPWALQADFSKCHEVDFQQGEGLACMRDKVDSLLHAIADTYRQKGIEQQPYVVVKADAGTYGMGILMLKAADELTQLNRKQRNKMSKTKGNQTINKVIIQEGIYSFEVIGDEAAVAEPVIYLIGAHVIGGFYRFHQGRGADENLNSPGMAFDAMPFQQACNNPNLTDLSDPQNRFYVYSVIARLAILAASREAEGLSAGASA